VGGNVMMGEAGVGMFSMLALLGWMTLILLDHD
jgi:hypothetical protein